MPRSNRICRNDGSALSGLAVDGSSPMDRVTVRCTELVDLHLESEIHGDPRLIVVSLRRGIRESNEHTGVIVVQPAEPLEFENEVGWHRRLAPVESQVVATRHGLKGTIDDTEPSLSDKTPVSCRKAVKERRETV